jgi:hypothetical protein
MAAGTWKVYGKAKKYLMNGTIKLGTGGTALYMCLLRQSATALGIASLSTRSTWASLSADEISALGGYAANGRYLGPSVGHLTVGASAQQYKFTYTTAGLVFTASGASLKNIRFAVIRNSTGAGAGKVLCFCTLSTAAFSIVSPNTLTILPPANGVFVLA